MAEGEGRLIVGRYRLHRVLGQGGMGTVWHATDEHLHRDVALKEIQIPGRTLLPTDPEVKRALREGRAAAKLGDHPGIITVYDVITDDHGLPWIVMQLLEGRSLSAALTANGPMTVGQTARVGVQVLAALRYAHQKDVLHRDVKPGNVMLAGSRVVLTDFGIATIEGVSVVTESGHRPVGSPEYIAPERIEGRNAQPSTDLWSVGVMLYAMLVGRSPFRRDSTLATTNAVLTQEPAPDEKIGPLWPVIRELLRKRPEERMTAEKAIDLLGRIPDGFTMSADAGRSPYWAPLGSPGAANVNAGTDLGAMLTYPPYPRETEPSWVLSAPTIDPPARPHRAGGFGARSALLVAVAVAAAATATVVVVGSVWGDGQEDPPPAAASTTTAGTSSTPELVPHEDPLGFEVKIPSDWEMLPSPGDGPIADVAWRDNWRDPQVGALVQVRRDMTMTGTPVTDYLEGRIGRKDGYHPIAEKNVGDSIAFREYTYREQSRYHHRWERVLRAPNALYTLTFALDANDDSRLADRWAEVKPMLDRMERSFRVTG